MFRFLLLLVATESPGFTFQTCDGLIKLPVPALRFVIFLGLLTNTRYMLQYCKAKGSIGTRQRLLYRLHHPAATPVHLRASPKLLLSLMDRYICRPSFVCFYLKRYLTDEIKFWS